MSRLYQESLLLQMQPGPPNTSQPTRLLHPPKPQSMSRDVMPHHITITDDEGDERRPSRSISRYGVPLYNYQQIPPYLKGNPYIFGGYRAHIPIGLCMRSLFIWSNETMNIWTHLLGFLYFFYLLINDNLSLLEDSHSDFGDNLTFTLMDSAFMTCMFCSAAFHLFNCISESASKIWLRLDLGGISVGLCGCYFPGAYYAFYCHAYWQLAYLVALLILAVGSMAVQLHPQFLSSQWHYRRLFLYSILIFAGMIPVTHWALTNGGFNSPLVLVFVPKIAVMYLLAIIGGTFYVTKFPECQFPGRVDFLGSSHQWWHLFVFLGYAWIHHCTILIYNYWMVHSCEEHFQKHQSLSSILGITD
ncbi:PREDICTED: progestin and adipoQ receptor family member 3-like [Amphimedon queenslandica]|uniref:Progestin and adipoQ receptor family member IIIb n=1 Tax=Amphimedon queenslandica TaxID=400682 RepID=A0A1X7VXK6_AMPQE|nr:PREDICTED: progestin and adipoQ receptor family member 3-like [Amphimedon queenslandica]|eukprot:XP_003382442.1 PREDICTED: progestin and adipoQ receptor family member 3-like [Amphimedon queenslandica]